MKNKNAHGVRGVASLVVALSHFVLLFLPFLVSSDCQTSFIDGTNGPLFKTLFSFFFVSFFYHGTLPVMMFFVLSGYVLTLPYYQKNNDLFTLQKRLWGRYLRLNLPVAVIVLLSYLIYSCHGYYNIDVSKISGSTDFGLYFKPGFSFLTALRDIFWGVLVEGSTNFNPVFWTLKAEFLGSLYLLLFYLVKPLGKNFFYHLAAMALIDFSIGKRSIFILAIFMGSLLHEITLAKKWHLPLFLCGLYFGGFQYRSDFYNFLPRVMLWPSNYFYVGIGAVLMMAPIFQGYGRTVLESSTCQFFGTISFPLYLIHPLVLCSFSSYLSLLLPPTLLALLINLLLFLSLSILFAVLFERYVDQPAIALSHRFSNFLFGKKT